MNQKMRAVNDFKPVYDRLVEKCNNIRAMKPGPRRDRRWVQLVNRLYRAAGNRGGRRHDA